MVPPDPQQPGILVLEESQGNFAGDHIGPKMPTWCWCSWRTSRPNAASAIRRSAAAQPFGKDLLETIASRLSCIGRPRPKAISAPKNDHNFVRGAVAGLIFFNRRVLLIDLSPIRSLLSEWSKIQYRRLRLLHALVWEMCCLSNAYFKEDQSVKTAVIAIALLGFVAGLVVRLNMFIGILVLLLLLCVGYSIANHFGFLKAALTIVGVQVIAQGSYFLGLVVRSFVGNWRNWVLF